MIYLKHLTPYLEHRWHMYPLQLSLAKSNWKPKITWLRQYKNISVLFRGFPWALLSYSPSFSRWAFLTIVSNYCSSLNFHVHILVNSKEECPRKDISQKSYPPSLVKYHWPKLNLVSHIKQKAKNTVFIPDCHVPNKNWGTHSILFHNKSERTLTQNWAFYVNKCFRKRLYRQMKLQKHLAVLLILPQELVQKCTFWILKKITTTIP